MQVEFRILGPMELSVDGRSIPLGSPKQRAVLAMLLLDAGRVVSTDSLIDRLWGDGPPARADNVLQTYISRLRGLLAGAVVGDHAPQIVGRTGGYFLVAQPESLDAHRFEKLVADGTRRCRERDMAGGLTVLREALSLWRGSALADLAEWSFARRAAQRLADLRLRAGEDAAEAQLTLGQPDEAIATLEPMTAAHPLRERPWGQLMLALYRAGRQAEALSTYHTLRRTLSDELAIEPSPPLRRLEQAILRHDPDLAGPDTATGGQGIGIVLPGRTRFVGRGAEMAALRDRLARAGAGTGGLMLIGGEPGVGKSRLCEQLAGEAAAAERFRVAVGHCQQSGRDVPYAPWVEMIETTARELSPNELLHALGDSAPEFARLVPGLKRVLPDLPAPTEVAVEQQRRFTFNSILDYLTRAGDQLPRLIVVEDLHWADEPTLLLIEHVAERLASIRCLLLGTYRDPPIDVTPLLAATLARLIRRRHAELLTLDRHSATEVEELLDALGGQTPPLSVTAAVHDQTGGNAFFVEEIFRHLTAQGSLFDDTGGYRQDIALGAVDVPAGVSLVTTERLAQLSRLACQVVSMAAVIGPSFSFDLLDAACELDDESVTAALEEAERAHLLDTRGTAHYGNYRFTHEIIRQALLARLPAARRRRHHLRVADALESLHAGEVAVAGTIAEHLIAAGALAESGRLFGHLLTAGNRALEAAAFEDAIRHLRRAEALAGHAAEPDQAELYLQLGRAERGIGRWQDAVVPWRRAIEIQHRLGDAEQVGRTCAEAAYSLLWAGRFEEAHELSRRGLHALGDRRNPDRARLLGMDGMIVAFTGDYMTGRAAVEQAVALAEELAEPTALGEVLLWQTMTHVVFMEMEAAVVSGRRGTRVLRSADQPWQLASTIGFLHECLVGVGHLDEAQVLNQELRPLAERLGNTGAAWHHVMVEGALSFCRTGDLDALEKFGRREIELCAGAGLGWSSWGLCWLAIAEFLRGDWDAAVAHAAQAQAAAAPTPMWGLECGLHFEYLAQTGRRVEALALLDAERHRLPRVGEPAGWGSWLMLASVVEGLLALGEREAAADCYPTIRYGIERTGAVTAYPNDCRLLQRVAGMAAAAGADWSAAEAHFTSALAQADTLPHRPEQAHVRRFFAGMLFDRNRSGDRDRAACLAGEAGVLYEAMAMRRHAAFVAALDATPG